MTASRVCSISRLIIFLFNNQTGSNQIPCRTEEMRLDLYISLEIETLLIYINCLVYPLLITTEASEEIIYSKFDCFMVIFDNYVECVN